MASNYPGSLDTFTAIASDKKTSDSVGGRTHRDMHNDLGDAVEAVQTELGTNPSGSDATVAARLTAIEAGTNLGSGVITSAKIADGTIVNDDINSSAAIARSKISGLPTSSTDNTIVRFDSTAGAMQSSGVVIDDNNRLTVATGDTGGYGFASGAVHLSGTGTPEGVVTAAPGSTWLQTDATTDTKGWLRWIKATGTGNTGWVAGPEADTGWRDVSSLLAADALAKVQTWTAVRLRRVGGTVHLLVSATVGTGTAAGTSNGIRLFTSTPAGFKGVGLGEAVGTLLYSGIYLCPVSYNASTAYPYIDGPVGATGRNWGAGAFDGQLSYVTADAWPSSLPGSAA